mmetsp:Transcript_7799/g.35358  ORF Transcript_7799/g.35358 Transcript_7799/m.35358 type:complete len:295 (-) Transcript_7799:27-911(-)
MSRRVAGSSPRARFETVAVVAVDERPGGFHRERVDRLHHPRAARFDRPEVLLLALRRLLKISKVGLQHPGVDESHRDSLLLEVARHGDPRHVHRGFAHAIREEPAAAVVPARSHERRDDRDLPARSLHGGLERLGHPDHAHDVHLEGARHRGDVQVGAEGLLRHLLVPRVPGRRAQTARVVHQHVHAHRSFREVRAQRIATGVGAHVDAGDDAPLDAHRFELGGGVAAGGVHDVAPGGELPAELEADAGAAARDHDVGHDASENVAPGEDSGPLGTSSTSRLNGGLTSLLVLPS